MDNRSTKFIAVSGLLSEPVDRALPSDSSVRPAPSTSDPKAMTKDPKTTTKNPKTTVTTAHVPTTTRATTRMVFTTRPTTRTTTTIRTTTRTTTRATTTTTRRSVYTVRFEASGVSSFPQTKSVYDGETVSMPSPSKEGYTFSGWYTDTNGYGTQYTSYTSIHRDVTLYAYFKIKTYTVSFYSNGAGTSYPPKTVEYNGTISLPTPTISGYNFDGWYTSSSGGTNMSLLVGEILRPDYHIIPEILFPCVKTQL